MFFGVIQTNEMTVKLFGVVVEAVVLLGVAAGVMFDFEVGVVGGVGGAL